MEGEIIGILEFYSVYRVQPDEELLNMMGHIGSTARTGDQTPARRRRAAASQSVRGIRESRQERIPHHHEPRDADPDERDFRNGGPALGESLQESSGVTLRSFKRPGANLLALINDILDLAKVESGHFELESIAFDLRALLKKIVEMMVSRAHDRGLRAHSGNSAGCASDLVGDPNRLRQILLNLIGNALKFTERGSVTLRVEK